MKSILFLAIGILVIVSAVLFLNLRGRPSQNQTDIAVKKAQEIYQTKKNQGVDMRNGPCLANELMPDWILDVAHNPREDIDNLAENQCPSFREGKAHHFVELDPDGNLIRVY